MTNPTFGAIILIPPKFRKMKTRLLLAMWLLPCFTSELPAQIWQTEILRTDIIGAWCRTADFDLDGDTDILVQAGDSVYWHENLQPGWEAHLIDPTFYNSTYSWVDVQDFDGDGDPDVLKAPTTGAPPYPLTWNENLGGGESWGKHLILEASNYVGWMQGSYGDLDSDGDLDIVVPEYTTQNTGYLYWLEYQSNTGTYVQHFIKSGDAVASTVADVDGDGDLDVVATQTGVSWLENQLPDTTWVEHQVEAAGAALHLVVESADLNGDGLPEIISNPLFAGNDKIVAYANPGWQPTDVIVATGVLLGEVGDINNDGEIDITYGSTGFTGIPQALAWAENQDNGTTWVLHDITAPKTTQLFCSGLSDIDGDGDSDMVSLDFNTNTGSGNVFWASNPLIDANAARINLHSVTTTRQIGINGGYTLNGSYMNNTARPKLENPDYFGEAGIYPKSVVITDDYGNSGSLGTITANNNIDLFFFGTFSKLEPTLVQFTEAELDSLYAWSKRGGKLIIASSSAVLPFWDPTVLNSRWGFGIEFQQPSIQIFPSSTGINTTIFDGPFGTVSSATEGGSAQGYFNGLSEDVVVLGEDASGNITLVLDCKTLDLIIADGDAYNSLGGVSAGPVIQNNNDRFWLNTIAYMDQLQDPPVVVLDGNTLSVSGYLSYQWLLNGQPIDGATDSTYTPAVGGNYSVLVSMSCGCEVTSEEVFITVNGVENPNPELEMSMSPNPATDWATLTLSPQKGEPVQVEMFDVNGRLVKSFEVKNAAPASFNLEGLKTGTYFIRVFNEKGMAVIRLVKI
jgi:Secretion system C-terminal sorting domain/FG-GAP-like repeat